MKWITHLTNTISYVLQLTTLLSNRKFVGFCEQNPAATKGLLSVERIAAFPPTVCLTFLGTLKAKDYKGTLKAKDYKASILWRIPRIAGLIARLIFT